MRPRVDIEAEFKKWKKDFDLDNVHVRVPSNVGSVVPGGKRRTGSVKELGY